MPGANIIGSGPNGLSAAIVLAHAGFDVTVYEAQDTIGGGARTLPLTLPGFRHDFGSAVHPMAAASPFFQSLHLEDHGLEWIHGDFPLAHPFDDGHATVIERDLNATARRLGIDGDAWRSLMQPRVANWRAFLQDALQPVVRVPRHPLWMAAFAASALLPAATVAKAHFSTVPARALFAGLAAHSFLPLDAPLSSAVALILGAAAHAEGWPVPRGGAQSIANALLSVLRGLGGCVVTGHEVRSLAQLPPADLTLSDVTPRQLAAMAAGRLSKEFTRQMQGFRYGPAAFKVDYALSAPVPWRAPECHRAITVHLGGTLEEIARAESATNRGRMPDAPFVLVSQPSLYDDTRAPAGQHVLWAYCHVPHGYTGDALPALEAQIERFAPGFRDVVLARSVSNPARLEHMDANLVGGDIQGGTLSLRQFAARPTARDYGTSNPRVWLCSASTPPGAGVHGMCGANAARAALRSFTRAARGGRGQES